jgi:hypothetical protein
LAQRLGEQGHEHVRERFLITSNVRRYLTLFLHVHENSVTMPLGTLMRRPEIVTTLFATGNSPHQFLHL